MTLNINFSQLVNINLFKIKFQLEIRVVHMGADMMGRKNKNKQKPAVYRSPESAESLAAMLIPAFF